jgi:hypothetical protein
VRSLFHRSVVLSTQAPEDVGRFLRFVLLFAVVMIQAFLSSGAWVGSTTEPNERRH